jgi:hypothetical protein
LKATNSSFILSGKVAATMRFDILLQFLVPLAMLAMWALTSLLNREAQSLPARGPVPNPGPGRPDAPIGRGEPGNAARLQPPASSVQRVVPQRWPEPTPSGRAGTLRASSAGDGILIIGSDNSGNRGQPLPGAPLASSVNARNSRGPQTRKGSRARPAGAAGAPKPKEADHQRALTSLVNQSLAQKKSRPLEIAPLNSPLSPIAVPLTQTSLGTEIEHPGSYQLDTALSSRELRVMISTSNKLREIALLTELLQPPVSLRAPRHPRR